MPEKTGEPHPPSKRSVIRNRSPKFQSIYANNAELGATTWDFRIRFGEIAEADEQKLVIDEHVVVTMSPQHTKVFLDVLAAHVKKYEDKFGPIKAE